MLFRSQSETSSRPTSSSGLSDWSVSSRGSFESFPSLRGHGLSPEDDATNTPFFSPDLNYREPSSPLSAQTPQIARKKITLRSSFTEEMDYHLWATYMAYAQDPTVTPFKAIPSTVPPNGVCHRVARVARRTWKGSRATSSAVARSASAAQRLPGCATPDPGRQGKGASSTPVPGSKEIGRASCRERVF